MYIWRISTTNVTIAFQSLSEQAKKTALLDSGATENFIDERTWKRMGIGRWSLATPLIVYNVDGSENKQGKVTHYCWLRILFVGQAKLQMFYITTLGKDGIILGYPFFYTFNPTIDWQKGQIKEGNVSLHTLCYKYHYKDIAKIQRDAIVQVGRPKENKAIYLQRNIAQD